jgi:hypothetical protein
MEVLQTSALPLGYGAEAGESYHLALRSQSEATSRRPVYPL